MGTRLWDRRSVSTGLGAVAASTWVPASADALGLADDKIKVIRYFSNSGDSEGRRGQPMVNQSSNVVLIETEGGLTGIGEGGEPTTMDECASMLIGQDPFRVDQHWQRMMRGYFYPAGREKLHSLGALDMALWDLKAKALGVPLWQLLGGKSRNYVECYATAFPRPRRARWKTRPALVSTQVSAPIGMLPTTRASAKSIASSSSARCTRTACCCTRERATAVGRSTSIRSSTRPTRSTSPRCSSRCTRTSAKI